MLSTGHIKFNFEKIEGWMLMYDDLESLWEMFESSGCIVYYLLYKILGQ